MLKSINNFKPLLKLRIYFELVRAKKTIWWWLNTLTGVFLASSFPPPFGGALTVIFAIGFTTFSVYALNDICDEELDRINSPDRPIPSRRLSRAEAMRPVLLLSAMGIIMASSLNIMVLFFTVIFFLVGVVYSVNPFRLRKGLLANPCMALGAAVSILAGASAVQIVGRALFGAVGMSFFVFALGSWKDMKDVEGDRAMGVRTLPVRIGEEKALKFLTVNSVPVFLILFLGYLFYSFNPLYLLMLVVAVGIYVNIFTLIWRNPKDRVNCERAYNRMILSGLFVILAFILGSICD